LSDNTLQLSSRKKDIFGLEEAQKWLHRLFGKKEKRIVIGIYGAPNAGKTTLANRIAMDCNVEPKGVVSEIPHETGEIVRIENLELNVNGRNLKLTILDTPGLATKISHLEFIKYGLSESEAIQRTREAIKGITKAIESMDEIDAAITVIDSTKMPYEQINIIILGTLEAKRKPTVVVANKIDLPEAKPELVEKFYPNRQIDPISDSTGKHRKTIQSINKNHIN